MPETVEVRRYSDYIRSHLEGVQVSDVKIHKGRYRKHGPFAGYADLRKALPLSVTSVTAKSKLTVISFDNGYHLLVTLGLNGGWAYQASGDDVGFPTIYDDSVAHEGLRRYQVTALKHLNVEFQTAAGSLFYYDTLSFGTLKVLRTEVELQRKLRTIGPDVMEPGTTQNVFLERLRLPRIATKPIGVVLLDQKIVSGVGNYLRADCLYMARLSPFRKVRECSDGELERLYRAIREMTWGLYDRKRGVQLGYIAPDAKFPRDTGRYFWIYNCETDPGDRTVIKQELYEGKQKRSIYWVRELQK